MSAARRIQQSEIEREAAEQAIVDAFVAALLEDLAARPEEYGVEPETFGIRRPVAMPKGRGDHRP